MSPAENSSGKAKRVFPERERRAEIADLHIFFRSMALICRFWGISFVYRVNGQKYAGDKMDQCRVLQENRPHATTACPPHEGVMSLHIKIEQAADVAVLQCVGRLVRGEPLHFLKQAVISLKQPRIVVLDLSGVETVDGGGLGMLVFLHRWTRENAIQLKLVNPSALCALCVGMHSADARAHYFVSGQRGRDPCLLGEHDRE